MMFDGMDFSFLYIVIPLVLFGPAMLGIVIIEVAADLIEDRGGRRTVAKAGIISIVAGYVVCVAGIQVLASIDSIDEYDLDDYAIAWICLCMITAYAAIIITAVCSWTHPWKLL